MLDFFGDEQFDKWQAQLDNAGIEYDIRNLCGCTFKEIQGYVNMLLRKKAQKMKTAEKL